jgi:hypothetical protein
VESGITTARQESLLPTINIKELQHDTTLRPAPSSLILPTKLGILSVRSLTFTAPAAERTCAPPEQDIQTDSNLVRAARQFLQHRKGHLNSPHDPQSHPRVHQTHPATMSVEAATAQMATTTLNEPSSTAEGTTIGAGGDKPINASQNEAVIASAAEGRRLYIGNLAYATTEGELKDFFKDYLVYAFLILPCLSCLLLVTIKIPQMIIEHRADDPPRSQRDHVNPNQPAHHSSRRLRLC